MGPDFWAVGLSARARANAAALRGRLHELALDDDGVQRWTLRVEKQTERGRGQLDVKRTVYIALLL